LGNYCKKYRSLSSQKKGTLQDHAQELELNPNSQSLQFMLKNFLKGKILCQVKPGIDQRVHFQERRLRLESKTRQKSSPLIMPNSIEFRLYENHNCPPWAAYFNFQVRLEPNHRVCSSEPNHSSFSGKTT